MKSILLFLSITCVCGTAYAEDVALLNPKDKLIVETVLRLKSFDIESSPPAKAAVLRYLRSQPGSDQYFELIRRFKPAEIVGDLVEFSIANVDNTRGVRAADMLFAMQSENALRSIVAGEDQEKAISAIKLIGHSGGKQTADMLAPLLTAAKATVAIQSAAISALGRQADGQQKVLDLVVQGKLSDELKFAAANALLSSSDKSIVEHASKYLSLPDSADSQPLPTMTELVKRRGDAAAGAIVFSGVGTCIKCHKVQSEGKTVGPDLTEIGSKLSREAMFVSILDPSAAISHNFETYSILTDEGIATTGLLISETDHAVTLRTSEGIDKSIDQETIEVMKKQTISLMPQDLQRLMTIDQLVDLTEYLMTLRRPEGQTVPLPTK